MLGFFFLEFPGFVITGQVTKGSAPFLQATPVLCCFPRRSRRAGAQTGTPMVAAAVGR